MDVMLGRLSSWFARLGDACPGGDEGFCPIRGWGKVRREHPAILIRFGGVKSHRAGQGGYVCPSRRFKISRTATPNQKGGNLTTISPSSSSDKSCGEEYG